MEADDLYPGRVFRETTGHRHMYVILGVYPFERLMGNWSSRADGKDATCLLVPADHPAIRHPSVMMYNYARPVSVQTLQNLIANGELVPDADVRPDVLERMQEGFFISPDTKKYLKKRYSHIRPQKDS